MFYYVSKIEQDGGLHEVHAGSVAEFLAPRTLNCLALSPRFCDAIKEAMKYYDVPVGCPKCAPEPPAWL